MRSRVIDGFIVVGPWLGAINCNEQARYVTMTNVDLTQRVARLARIDLATDVFALFLRTVVAGGLDVRGGVRATLTGCLRMRISSLCRAARRCS